MDRLNNEFLWRLLLNLDHLELENIRRTSRHLQALVSDETFSRTYNRENRGSLWNYVHFYSPHVPHAHQIIGEREDDRTTMEYPLTAFGMDLDFEEGAFELIGVFRNILVFFYAGGHGFLVCNLFTMTSRIIECLFWDMINGNVLEWGVRVLECGIRIIEDPVDPLHFIIVFALPILTLEELAVVYCVYHSSQDHWLYINIGESTLTNNLTPIERRHPVYMVIPAPTDPTELHLSIRNRRLAHLFADHVVVMNNQGQYVLAQEYPVFVPRMTFHYNNEGFMLVLESWVAQGQGGVEMDRFGRMVLYEMTPNYSFRSLSGVPNEHLPDEAITFRHPYLRAYEDFVEFSFHVFNPQQPNFWQSTIFKYAISADTWTVRILALPVNGWNGWWSHLYC